MPVAEGLDLQKYKQNLISATTRPQPIPCVGSQRPGHSLSPSAALSGSRPAAEGPSEGEAVVPAGRLTAGSSQASLSLGSFSVGCSPAPAGPAGQPSPGCARALASVQPHRTATSWNPVRMSALCAHPPTYSHTHTCVFSRRYTAQCWGMPDVK